MKPLPPIRAIACERAEASGSSGRGNGMRSMITSWQAEPGTSTPCQSDSVPNRQVAASRANWRTSVEVWSSPWQRNVDVGRRSARASPRPRPRAARMEENSPRVRPPAARTSCLDLVERLGRRCRRGPAPAGAWRRRRWPARVVERAADVEALPRRGRPRRAARACRRRRRTCRRARAWPRSGRRCGRRTPCRAAASPRSSARRAAPGPRRGSRLTHTTSSSRSSRMRSAFS